MSTGIEEGSNVFGWECVRVLKTLEFGTYWPFGPLFSYPASKYVFLREVHGRHFTTDVVIGNDVPAEQHTQIVYARIFNADDALDQIREWPNPPAPEHALVDDWDADGNYVGEYRRVDR